MTMDVLTAARNVGADYRGGVVALAPQIGKNHNTLSAELRAEGTAKLGLLDAVKMTVESRDYRILDAFNLTCGRMSIPLAELLDLDGDDCMRALGDVSREFAELCAEACKALDDGLVKDNELRRVEREAGHLIAKVNGLLAAMAVRNKAGKPPLDAHGAIQALRAA